MRKCLHVKMVKVMEKYIIIFSGRWYPLENRQTLLKFQVDISYTFYVKAWTKNDEQVKNQMTNDGQSYNSYLLYSPLMRYFNLWSSPSWYHKYSTREGPNNHCAWKITNGNYSKVIKDLSCANTLLKEIYKFMKL